MFRIRRFHRNQAAPFLSFYRFESCFHMTQPRETYELNSRHARKLADIFVSRRSSIFFGFDSSRASNPTPNQPLASKKFGFIIQTGFFLISFPSLVLPFISFPFFVEQWVHSQRNCYPSGCTGFIELCESVSSLSLLEFLAPLCTMHNWLINIIFAKR